jgi:general secretion pathway protein G
MISPSSPLNVPREERAALKEVTKEMANKTPQAGFTLIELLVVMVILGLLAALVVPNYIRQGEKSKLQAARAQVELMGAALDMFRLDVGRYPTSQEGLEALRERPSGLDRWDGPYLKKEIPRDPWGTAYVYRSPGENAPYELQSYGADGIAGGSGDGADIKSWEG